MFCVRCRSYPCLHHAQSISLDKVQVSEQIDNQVYMILHIVGGQKRMNLVDE